ncbi:MAG: DUF4304 domain-containing protein [Phycisphaeraceae bacterium]|nr:DUF4304 domain-containing protein [Phycisphaeraceae bacterium]
MNCTEMAKVVRGIARPLGYRGRGGLFWRTGDELTRLIHLQRSRWGAGVYVNCGVVPSRFVIKRTPPGSGYWGVEFRPTSWHGPHFDLFCRCEADHEDRMSARTMTRGLRWLVGWMDETYSDEDRVRALVLNRSTIQHAHSTIAMKDWARGRLRAPAHYFDGASHF